MSNHRTICSFCKNDILTRDIGKHILKSHESLVFSPATNEGVSNLRSLWRDKALSEPLFLDMGDKEYYACFADLSCIKNLKIAEDHFKGRQQQHREKILALRDVYAEPAKSGSEQVKTGITASQTDAVQEIIFGLLEKIRDYESQLDRQPGWDFKHRFTKAKKLLPFSLDEQFLKQKFDPDDEEESVESTKPSDPEPEVKPTPKPEPEPPVSVQPTESKPEPKPSEPELTPMEQMCLDVIKDKTISQQDKQQYLQTLVSQKAVRHPTVIQFLDPQLLQFKPQGTPVTYPTIITNSKRRPNK